MYHLYVSTFGNEKPRDNAEHQMGHLILESSGKILHWFMCRIHVNKIKKFLGYLKKEKIPTKEINKQK